MQKFVIHGARYRDLPWLMTLLSALILVGCSKSSSNANAKPEKPLRALRAAIRNQQWQQAWELSDAVRTEHPDDSDVVATLARVAHENKQPEAAADLLVEACRMDSFAKGPRVLQAMIAMISVGRLHEGMEMLEEALRQQPQQHETRRWLYDFYMGTENRVAGVHHGRFLVRERRFDLPLLLALSNTERRTQDADPLDEMTSRNPNDKRPLLGTAKAQFDDGDYEKSIETLESVVAAHEDYLPAQALLGRALAAASRYEELERWASAQDAQIEKYDGYWIGVGDWARSRQQTAAAARAYWEATRRDPDVMESWSKLSTTLEQLPPDKNTLSAETLDRIKGRVNMLSTFNQLKSRFERTGSISRAIAVDIADALYQLGRLWEAEAWVAIAMTLPEDDAVQAQKKWDEIVAQLSEQTPWQLTDSHPELQLDLASLEMPAIGSLASSGSRDTTTGPLDLQADLGNLRLTNEAAERELTFFGRTSDRLDHAGIMLYQTLGCGGGAIDFDLDGWSDLYLVAAGGTPPNRDSAANSLWRNVGGAFADSTAPAATGDTGFGQGVAVGDVNEDGFADLLLLNYGENTLLVNNGDGTFKDASDRIRSAQAEWSTSAAIADLDGDGLSDLVIVNYCAGLEPVTKTCPMKEGGVFRSCTPVMFPGAGDVFLQSDSQGNYVDRTSDWNASPSVVGRGLGIVAGSFDQHQGVDVFVANDMTNNHYWSRSLDDGSFSLSESGVLRGLAGDDRALAQGSMGIASGDLDSDGDIDFYVTNFQNEYNTYHQQSAAGIWQDATSNRQLIAATMPLVGFGSEAVDLDSDGTLELLVTNGHVDIFSRGEEQSVYAQPMQLFRRNRSDTFDSIGEAMNGEYVSSPHVGRALWTLDANRDGLTDVAVTHQTEPVALLVNRAADPGRWLEIKLVGRSCIRDAVGAIVQVTSGGQTWTAPVTSGDGYLCSNERLLRFGLGNETANCDVTVNWPDGRRQTHRGLQPQTQWLLVQGDEVPFRLE
jgi:tetratricopeptide (TPR) repeat protein